MELYPLQFEANMHYALWGVESWEISGYRSSPSVVASGSLKGRNLEDLAKDLGAELTGLRAPAQHCFPLLFKVIDAKDRLSLQVHPNSCSAALTGGEPKAEMWHVLESEDCAAIFAGLRPGVDERTIRSADNEGFEHLAYRIPVSEGQSYFIPGGLVHSICAGTRIYEVQQPSDTTYRLSDWGRLGTDGKPRPLHMEKGIKSIDFTLDPPNAARNVESGYFSFRVHDIDGCSRFSENGDEGSFHALFVKSVEKQPAEGGGVRLEWNGGEIILGKGASVLVPPGMDFGIESSSKASILDTFLP